MKVSVKPLGVVKTIVESAGMDIAYAYEDLVFLEHNSFLLQFTENANEILVHINREADRAVVSSDIDRLQDIALSHQMRFLTGDLYSLDQVDDESIRLEFHEQG